MLYPDFNDLIAFKGKKSELIHPHCQSVKSLAPGNHHSPFRGQGLEFESVREYVPGDDIRNIDWRVTARTGLPHLKIFNEDRERHVTICVDVNATMRFGTKNTFKSIQAARTAALLGWQGIAAQDRVSACLFGDVNDGIQFFEPQRKRNSFYAVLKMLSLPPSQHNHITMEQVFQRLNQIAPKGALTYFISDFMTIDHSLRYELNKFHKNNPTVFIAINDQADQSLLPVGMLGFSSSQNKKFYIDTHNTEGRDMYALQWKQNREQLFELTSALKIPLLELTTMSDIHRELILGMNKISKRRRK